MSLKIRSFGRFIYKVILNYFLQGLIILAPIAVTAVAIYTIFDKVDSILRPSINIPGLGFLIIIGGVILVGWISSFFVMSRVLSIFDHWLERTPVIKFIYSSLRDFFEAFAGNKRKFDKAVLVNVKGEDVWQVGFITQEDTAEFDLPGYVAVYVPQSYALAGQLYIVPRSKVRLLPKVSAAEAMRFAISGGVTEVEVEEEKIPSA
ncbi:DUF502 domain-containing protein [Dinghuibacter silviterrae]|uniref:Putative membrane protein n=1 Tax=Dinghuibacter silviterrae TaxID=1539049 RepID=A0A4R8DPW7_9BACT|nr:DUF502 domain-containing protein [Dinghuibacter silviterrae]TDW99928.1 putative membrane protein [Dinghuibacter silviterrae]